MAVTLRHKRSGVASAAPSAAQLVAGELAMNTADGIMFMKRDDGAIISFKMKPDNALEADAADTLYAYAAGATGTGTGSNWYRVAVWTVTAQYNNFNARFVVTGRGNNDHHSEIAVRAEFGATTWGVYDLDLMTPATVADGDMWKLVLDNTAKTATLYYRRSGTDWDQRQIHMLGQYLSGCTYAYYNNNTGTTEPTGDFVVDRSLSSYTRIYSDNYKPLADKLTTARSIALSGDVTGSANFDGSAGISISATVVGKEPTIAVGTTAQYWRGDKSWRDLATDVRAVVLTGLSTATNSAITASDTVLVASGKLQAQLNAMNASNLASGTVPDARLSGIYTNASIGGASRKIDPSFTTTSSGAGSSGQWTKVATISVAAQYADTNLRIMLLSYGSGSTAPKYSFLNFRVKQQVAFGGDPYVGALHYMEHDSSETVGYVITSNAGPALVDIYVRADATYTTVSGHVLAATPSSGSITLTYYSNQAYVASVAGLNILTKETSYHSGNFGSVQLNAANLTGTVADARLSGTYTNVSIGGNAATATKLFTPRLINGVAFDGTQDITIADATKLPTTGGTLSGDLTVGATTRSANTFVRALSADGYTAGLEAYGSAQGTGYCYVGQEGSHGGGVFYNGDGTPAFATGETADRVSFYRRSAGVNEVVFSYAHNSNDVTFRGSITGNGSGLTTLNATQLTSGTVPDARLTTSSVGGNAGTATKLFTSRLINGVAFDGTADITVPLTGVFADMVTLGGGSAKTYRSLSPFASGLKSAKTWRKLATLPVTSSSNRGGVMIQGFATGFTDTEGKAYISLSLSNRNTEQFVGSILGTLGNQNIEIFKEADNSHSVYAVTNGYAGEWCLDMGGIFAGGAAGATYEMGTSAETTTTPTGTLVWNLAANARLNVSSTGLVSPTMTGTPVAPTAAVGTNTTQVATTAFVQAEIANDAPSKTGTGASGSWSISVTGNAATATVLATPRLINGVAFDGSQDITIADATKEPTIAAGTNLQFYRGDKTWTDFATTTRGVVLTGLSTATSTAVTAADSVLVAMGKLQAQVTLRATLASPSFTGTPLAPTAAQGTNTTQIATTAFVQAEIAADTPTKTGGGASGSWGIDITGNAATATALQNARLINGVSFNGTANITVLANPQLNNIVASTDLNTVTTNGRHYCPANVTVATLANCPTTNAFTMFVSQHAGTRQELWEYMTANPRGWFRNYYSTAWGPWIKIFSGVDGDPTKLDLAGGKMTGVLAREMVAGPSGIHIYRYPGGGAYNSNGTSVAGTLKITLPYSWSNTMIKIKLSGYTYQTDGASNAFEIILSGYNYSTTPAWVNCSAHILGVGPWPTGSNVRFGHDGSKCCILLGSVGSTLPYPKVVIEEVMATFGVADSATWESGWVVSQITSEAGITVSKTVKMNDKSDSAVLQWRNYGAGHVIFDGSAGLAPDGTAISNTDSTQAWVATYPTLMGWNGTYTYGVRVDRARQAESLVTARTINGVSFNGTANITIEASPSGGTWDHTSNISFLNGGSALGIRVGQLLVSNSYADESLVPTNGAYVKGKGIYGVQAGSMTVSNSSGSAEFRNTGGTGDGDMAMAVFHCTGQYAIKLGCRADGVFGLGGYSSAAWRWYSDASGNMVASGNVIAYSDIRLKKNIKKIPKALSKVKRLRGVTFDRTDVELRQTGLIAQEVQKVLPEAVTVGADGDTLGVSYGNMMGLMVEAIKEVDAKYQKEIAGLKDEISELKQMVAKLLDAK